MMNGSQRYKRPGQQEEDDDDFDPDKVPLVLRRGQTDSSGADQPPLPAHHLSRDSSGRAASSESSPPRRRPLNANDRSQSAPTSPPRSQQQQQAAEDFTLRSFLPSAWAVRKDNPYVKLKRHPLRLVGKQTQSIQETVGEEHTVLVLTNKPIPMEVLQKAAWKRQATRQEFHGELRDLKLAAGTKNHTSAVDVYYFEATIKSGVTWIGLVPSTRVKEAVLPQRWPGDAVGSIGMSSDGRLFVSGRQVDANMHVEPPSSDRETIGCGMEISSVTRVFFTKNGTMLISPLDVPELNVQSDWYFPAVALSSLHGDMIGNFGISNPFRWKGDERHVLFSPSESVQVPSSPKNLRPALVIPEEDEQSQFTKVTLGTMATATTRNHKGSMDQQADATSPYARMPTQGTEATTASSPFARMPSQGSTATGRLKSVGQPESDRREQVDDGPMYMPTTSKPAARYARHKSHESAVSSRRSSMDEIKEEPGGGGEPSSKPSSASHGSSGSSSRRSEDAKQSASSSVPLYGRPADKHVRLDEDFPAPAAVTGAAFPSHPYATATSGILKMTPYPSTPSSSSSDPREEKKAPARLDHLTTPTLFEDDMTPPLSNSMVAKRPPTSIYPVASGSSSKPGAVWEPKSPHVVDEHDIDDAESCARDLRRSCEDESTDSFYLNDLLQTCKERQDRVRRTLEDSMMKFDDPNAERTISALLNVNEVLLDSIDAAERHLKGETKPASRESVVIPPSESESPAFTTGILDIETLIRRKDVFSLICMLRSQSDKRSGAALAIMRYLREAEESPDAESLQRRNEIRSSGGMDSLLALFHGKGTPRQLKVVAALAVAYLLPAFEQSDSIGSFGIGLKIVECLRFLFTAKPVIPNGGKEITRDEMRIASARGVYTFWFSILSPSLSKEATPVLSSTSSSPDLVRRPSLRMRKSRAAGNVFDQRQEVLEMHELLEMTVSLIVEMAKESDLADTCIQLLVYPICSIDQARPIAVREGLLKVLVSWMGSRDREKLRCAATSVNELTSTVDNYMAGWIHSQIVNEGALAEIANLSVCASAGNVVRLAVAEILCRLCGAPHTRAAVVEAACISCLISLLYEYSDPESRKVAFAAGSALLQLVAGAMTRASVFVSDDFELDETPSLDKRDRVISDVLNGGAVSQFVAMARFTSQGKLRAMSVEALRVLSEDTHPSRRTRLQLVENDAAAALGHVLKDDLVGSAPGTLALLRKNDGENAGMLPTKMDEVIKELHHALCAWANILDHREQFGSHSLLNQSFTSIGASTEEILAGGCTQFAEAGGLESLIITSSLPCEQDSSVSLAGSVDKTDLAVEACRSLASLSPLLLSSHVASRGYAAWSITVLQALARILSNAMGSDDTDESDVTNELKFDALRGIGSLAKHEPHKMIIVDKYLPSLFHAKMARGDSFNIANAAGQVCLSLGFSEDELAQQICGSDPKLMGDWFCMQRSLLIQSMARAEIRQLLFALWKEPLGELLSAGAVPDALGRSISRESTDSGKSDESGRKIRVLEDVFEALAFDKEGSELREDILQQYYHVYEREAASTSDESLAAAMRDWRSSEPQSKSLLASHVYPLDSTVAEKEWMMAHRVFMERTGGKGRSVDVTSSLISDRVQGLMDSCIPSRSIQQYVIPIFDLKPESSFDFRGLLMPQRRYFSFRREGQLVARLCEMDIVYLESEDVHWTLGFTNSSFAGEFSETLVQALYRCPLIKGISFARNSKWRSIWESESEDEGQDTGLLANLAGSLPPWVSSITYDNILTDFSLTALAAILETMGRLSAGQESVVSNDLLTGDDNDGSLEAQRQGSFRSFALRNSPHLSYESWSRFFSLLGRSPGRDSSLSRAPPLASLRVLDLSGNQLGDMLCSLVLERALNKDSGCCLEQLDLSGNCIRQGARIVKTLYSYVNTYRRNQSSGVALTRGSWRSSLISLNLGSNELDADEGGLAIEVLALLRNNILSLRSLDLSNNGLVCQGYQFSEVLKSSLVKNTCIHHLNLSGNKFGRQCVDNLLDELNRSDADSGLAFLQLENNVPLLTDAQRNRLKSFVNISRTFLLRRYIQHKLQPKTGDTTDIDSMAALREDQIVSLPEEAQESVVSGVSSVWDALSASDDGLARRRSSLRRSSTTGKGENMITVLFSAPLVFYDDQHKLRPFAKLDFDMERELLWQCLKEARRDIELIFDTATHHRLLSAKTKRCSCLHYSGHGHSTHLPFEDGKGGPHWLEVNEIKTLISQNEGAPFKFVFVSACHSGLAGETFASAGVPHVVCCQQESELKDSAALAFTRQFYLALAVGHTVKESFEQGCKAVRATPNLRNAEEEMKKFILLPKEGNHDVPVFDAKALREWPRTMSGSTRSLQRSKSRRGSRNLNARTRSIYFGGARSSELSVRNMMQEDPSPTPPQSFAGREVDMYHVLNLILNKRLVSVIGEKGVGRSSLVYALCHYVNERSSTILQLQRIYFVKATQNRGSDRFVTVLRELLKKLIQDGRGAVQGVEDMDLEMLINAISKVLKDVKALLVIDRTEFLEGSAEAQDLVVFLSNLFQETRTKHVRVLLTGRAPLGIPSIGGVVEQPYHLGPLNFQNTVRLFGNLCPHLHTAGERHKFYKRLVVDGDQSDVLPNDEATSQRTRMLFEALGNGIPSRTEKAAYSISSDELSRLGINEEAPGGLDDDAALAWAVATSLESS